DAQGNFALQPLPYVETFLEPSMDQETLHLHYTFHHGDAVKAANKDLEEVKKAIDSNSLDTVDYWTKKLAYHLSSHILHTIFWTNLANKKSEPGGDLLAQIKKDRSEEHTSDLQSRLHLVCRLLLEKKKKTQQNLQNYNNKLIHYATTQGCD